MPGTALLIIDVQAYMFDEQNTVYKAGEFLATLKALYERVKEAGMPVIFIRHDGGRGAIDEYGAPGWQIHPRLAPQETDIVIDKRARDAFIDTPLHSHLQRLGVNHLVITGIQTDFCVNATTQRAAQLGYDITVISDGHSTFDSEDATAAQIIDAYNETVATFATVIPASRLTLPTDATQFADYLSWLADGRWIRVRASAIIFNEARDHILVERNNWIDYGFYNFIGGGVEVTETLETCIARELSEETDAQIMASRYLFVVENFFPHEGQMRHSLEHYFLIKLDRDEVTPHHEGVEFQWLPIDALHEIDLRPTVVRDAVADGSYARVTHLILRDGQ